MIWIWPRRFACFSSRVLPGKGARNPVRIGIGRPKLDLSEAAPVGSIWMNLGAAPIKGMCDQTPISGHHSTTRMAIRPQVHFVPRFIIFFGACSISGGCYPMRLWRLRVQGADLLSLAGDGFLTFRRCHGTCLRPAVGTMFHGNRPSRGFCASKMHVFLFAGDTWITTWGTAEKSQMDSADHQNLELQSPPWLVSLRSGRELQGDTLCVCVWCVCVCGCLCVCLSSGHARAVSSSNCNASPQARHDQI